MTGGTSPAGKWIAETFHGDAAIWDAFVWRSPQANPFATHAWLEASAAEAGAGLDLWIVRKGDEWVAALALPYRTLLGRRVHVGLPLAAYSSILYRPPASAREARTISERHEVTAALLEALEPKYRSLDLMLSPGIDDARPWIWRGWRAVPRYTCIMDLRAAPEPSEAARRHVRKGDEDGLTLSTVWDFDAFWSAFSSTSRRQGFGVGMPRIALQRLAGRLNDAGLAWMATARGRSGDVAASQIVLANPAPGGIFMWVAGTRADLLSRGVSAWHMLETAAEARQRGHARWDLCGADLPTVARFKAELGARLDHYFEVQAPLGLFERFQHAARGLRRAVRGVRPGAVDGP